MERTQYDRERYLDSLEHAATTEHYFAGRLVCVGHRTINAAHGHAWHVLKTWTTVPSVDIRGPRQQGMRLIVTVKRKKATA